MCLELGEGHFNGVEIGRIRRKVKEPTAMLFERGRSFSVFVRCQVVADDNCPGSNSGVRTSRMYAAKASPSIAPLITQGATRLSWVKPAIKVCVPHAPNGAFISRRLPRGHRPRSLVRLVLTDVSSMNTNLVGCARMAGIRCLTPPAGEASHGREVSRQPPAIFFICVPQLAQKAPD